MTSRKPAHLLLVDDDPGLLKLLGMRLAVMHNLWFYNHLMQEIRDALDEGRFEEFRAEYSEKMSKRI